MAEEYKRKWHETHNPREDDKVYLGTRLLDAIEKAAIDTYQDERTLEGWEWANPISVGTAGAIRTVEGVGTVLANTPVVAQGLQAYGKVADVAAGNVGSLIATTGLDPRFGGWAVRLGEAWYGGKAISAASKSKYAKAAGKFAKIQADEVGMKASMLTKKKHGKVWKNPKAGVEPDPWFAKDDVGGPPKTYERFAKRTYYPTQPLRDLWETQIQSKSKFPTDLDRMSEGLPPLRQRLMDDIDGNPWRPPEPMWGPPNPRYESFIDDYFGKEFLTADEIGENVMKLEKLERGGAVINPGGTISGGITYSDIVKRISGDPRKITAKGKPISSTRYKLSEFKKLDADAAGYIRDVNARVKTFKPEQHHIASLGVYKKAIKSLPVGERQLAQAYLVDKGILVGNHPFNKAILGEEVHQEITNWITKNMNSYIKSKGNISKLSLEKRWEIFDELADLTHQSEEKIFELVQVWNQIKGVGGEASPEVLAKMLNQYESLEDIKLFNKKDFDFRPGSGMSNEDFLLRERKRSPKKPDTGGN